MNIRQVAAQLYTVRDFIRTADEFAASMKKVRAIGYQAVQISGQGPIPEGEIRRICEGEGLTICATHEGPELIVNDPVEVVRRLDAYGCQFTAFPHPGPIPVSTLDEVQALAARLNSAGKILHDAGKTLTYHNHSLEFRRVGGRLILDILYNETDARYLQGEIDTYWVQHGGGDPFAWCARMKDRLPLLHLKDYAVNDQNAPAFAEIGAGNLDWPRILAAAQSSNCQWFIVEQDTCPGDPFDSLKQSFDYIAANLAA
ncbi:MAG TPA: sugar phosphate isomerase/epimerase [Armatimonadota bacterium]|jgi:sugar phosphate isomerase/epimerase